MANLNDYLTIKEAAGFLGVSPMTLRRWDKRNKFKAIRHPINNYRLYKRQELEEILREIETARERNRRAF